MTPTGSLYRGSTMHELQSISSADQLPEALAFGVTPVNLTLDRHLLRSDNVYLERYEASMYIFMLISKHIRPSAEI